MPYDSDMDLLILLAGEARKNDAWLEFSRFCERRGQGVRAEAMEHLDQFMRAAACWSFDGRMVFSQWVLWRSRKFCDDRIVLPHSLREQFIIPTLRHWSETASRAAEPRLWLGILRCDDPSHHLEQALELDPSCELARQTDTQDSMGCRLQSARIAGLLHRRPCGRSQGTREGFKASVRQHRGSLGPECAARDCTSSRAGRRRIGRTRSGNQRRSLSRSDHGSSARIGTAIRDQFSVHALEATAAPGRGGNCLATASQSPDCLSRRRVDKLGGGRRLRRGDGGPRRSCSQDTIPISSRSRW